MRDDLLKAALEVVPDPNILVNIVSLRVKQLIRGSRPLVESLEKLSLPDTALREVAEGRISYEAGPPPVRRQTEPHIQPAKKAPAGPRMSAI